MTKSNYYAIQQHKMCPVDILRKNQLLLLDKMAYTYTELLSTLEET